MVGKYFPAHFFYNKSLNNLYKRRAQQFTTTSSFDGANVSDTDRELNRLLRAASAFDKSTKSSLKVYHLQECGKLCDRFNPTVLDDRLRRLISQINLDLHILSPAQLVAVALAYRNISFNKKSYWSKLCYEVYRHAKSYTSDYTGMTRNQVAMILGCYATLFTEPLKQTNDLIKWITFDVGSLNEYDYASLTYYMYRVKMSNGDEFNLKCLKAITMGYLDKLHLFSPKSLVCVLNNYSKMQLLPWHIIFRTNNLLKSKVSKLNFKCIAIHLRSLMNVRLRDLGLLNQLSKRISKDSKLVWAGPLELSTIIYAMGKLGYRNRSLLSSLIGAAERCVFVMSDADLMRTTHGFANLGVAVPSLWTNISKVLQNKIDSQPPQHLAIIVSSFGKVGIIQPEIFDLKNRFEELSSGFTCRQIISLLDGFVILGYYDKDFICKLLNCYLELQDRTPDFIESQISRIANALLLEFPESLESASNAVQAFIINNSQNNASENEITDFEKELSKFIYSDFCLANIQNDSQRKMTEKELNDKLKVANSIGMYKVHLLSGKNAVDFLSKGQLCPLTEKLLGPALMKSRHMELLGYNYRIINRSNWNKANHEDKIVMLKPFFSSIL